LKCVVTGASGFIGSHLVDILLEKGHEVIGVDDGSTGRDSNLAQTLQTGRFRLVRKCITQLDPRDFGGSADWVFHIAGRGDIVPSIERPEDYFCVNVKGTLDVLQLSRALGARRFLYAASSSCYGIPDVYPTPETCPCRPMHPYALTKHLGEQLVMHWSQVYRVPAVSLRLFNVYGPRSRTTGAYGAVFGVFLKQKLAGKPFTVVGDGKQTRDFTFVSDVARAFLLAAESDLAGEILNAGSGNTYSVNRLVELLGGTVTHVPKRPGEPDCTFADIGKIQRTLGWKPRVTFEQGVARLLDCIESWREAPLWDEASIAKATEGWFKYLAR